MPPDSDVQKEIEQLEQRFSENAQGLVFAHLADAYRRAGEFAKAEGLLLHGLKTHATYTSAYNVLGRVYLESERYADAHEQFSKVLELDPQNLIALRALGDLAARGGRLEDARSWYERMLQIDPRSKEAQEGLDNLEAEGKAAEAEDVGEPGEGEEAVAPPPVLDVAAEPEAEQPPEEAAAVAEEAPQPWDFGELFTDMGPEEDLAEMGEQPIEDLVADEEVSEPSDEGDTAQPEPWEVSAEETVPADGFGEPGAEESATAESAEPGEVSPSEPAIADASSDGSRSSEGAFNLDDLDLGIMDDWTPGFLGGEKQPGAETFETENILESLSEGLGFDLGGSPFEEDEFEEEEPASKPEEAVVTETMAELYANQGLYQDALDVYRQLAEGQPDDERIQSRIAELEAKLAEARSDVDAGEEELAELLELTQPVAAEPEPEAEVSPAFSAGEAEDRETAGETFEFEDEAPAAGIEHLDPFAVSFDVIAMEARAAETPAPDAVVEPSESEVEEPAEAEAEVPTAFELSVGEVEGIAEAVAAAAEGPGLGGEPEAGEDVIQEAVEEVAEAVVFEVVEESVEPVVLEVEEEVEEDVVEAVVLEVEEEVVEAVVLEVEDEFGEEVIPDVEKEAAVQAMAAEEEPEPYLTPPEDQAVSGVDTWELAVEITDEEAVSELDAQEFGAEIEIDEPATEVQAERTLADFETSELVSDFAPPQPESVSEPDSEEPTEYTIEDYLGGLLSYDAEAVSAEENAEEAEAASESRPEPDAAVSDTVDSDTAGSEDLEQFQEWLRSLKR